MDALRHLPLRLRVAARLLPAVALLASCKRAPSPPRPLLAVAEPLPPSPSVALAVVAAPPAPAPLPAQEIATLDPPLPPLAIGLMSHAGPFGWARDGAAFGYCTTLDAGGGTACELRRPRGATERLLDPPGSDDAYVRLHDRFEARLDELAMGSAPARWPYAADLDLTWDVTPGAAWKAPCVPAILTVGARVRGERPALPIRLLRSADGARCWDRIHPEVIALSPDGRTLGIVAHACSSAGEPADQFPIALVPAAEIAAQAYDTAGVSHLRKHDFPGAAALLEKAVAADPRSRPARYDLARAYARLWDPRAEAALAEAIARGGETVKSRARLERDFAGVRKEAWFTALLDE
jgi:hypothetical protein